MSSRDLAEAAESLVGTRFRLHGRDPAQGLDCIGLLGAAMARIGQSISLPTGYRLRVIHPDLWIPDPHRSGFERATPPFLPGDVVLIRVGAAQAHLLIAAPKGGWIHAHAGLRRVVHQPERPPGEVLHHWRLAAST